MHTFSIVIVSLLASLPFVISAPVPDWSSTVVNKPAVDDEASKARVAAYSEADTRAKEMVNKMVTVANSDKPEHQKIVNDAFGPNADRAVIKDTINKLNTQQVRIGTTDIAGVKDTLVATTPAKRPNGPTGDIKLGPNFFAADSSKDYRAGTLIHEATHQLAHTGDLINTNDKIIGALEDQKKDVKMQEPGRPHVGYHFPGDENPKEVPKSADDLSAKYKSNLNTVKDMHNNADSYRVFAHLCSQPGVARRDLELFGRALLEADEDEHFYLSKRQSCALPPDYFKRKAEAKAAAAKTAGLSAAPSAKKASGAHSITHAAPHSSPKLASPAEKTSKAAISTKRTSHVTSKMASPLSKVKTSRLSTKSPSRASLLKGSSSKKSSSKLGKDSSRLVKVRTSATKKTAPVSPKAKRPSAATGRAASSSKSHHFKAVSGKNLRTQHRPTQSASHLSKSVFGKKSHTSAKSTKHISHFSKGALTRTSRLASKAARKSSLRASKGPATRVSRVSSPRHASQKSASHSSKGVSGVKLHTSARSTKPFSHLSKVASTRASTRASRVASKAARKSSPRASKGTAIRVSRVSSPRRASQKSASHSSKGISAAGVKSHTSAKSTKPFSHLSKGASTRTSRASTKAARKFAPKAPKASRKSSRLSTKSAKPMSRLAKAASTRHAAGKLALKASKGTAKPASSPRHASLKAPLHSSNSRRAKASPAAKKTPVLNSRPQKKAVTVPQKKLTSHAPPQKKGGKK